MSIESGRAPSIVSTILQEQATDNSSAKDLKQELTACAWFGALFFFSPFSFPFFFFFWALVVGLQNWLGRPNPTRPIQFYIILFCKRPINVTGRLLQPGPKNRVHP